jgi:hypothetical protein
MDDDNKPKPKPVRFNTEIFGVINDAVTANATNIQQLYDVVVDCHQRLNRLEKEFLALEKRVKKHEKNHSR